MGVFWYLGHGTKPSIVDNQPAGETVFETIQTTVLEIRTCLRAIKKRLLTLCKRQRRPTASTAAYTRPLGGIKNMKEMFLLTYHCKPQSQTDDLEDVAGAYINCWIEAENFEQAGISARQELDEMDWQVLELEEAFTVTREDYSEDPNGLEYYEQALIDKQVFLIHTYPIEEEK